MHQKFSKLFLAGYLLNAHQKIKFICLFFLALIILMPASAMAAARYVYTANYFGSTISTYRVEPGTGMLRHHNLTPTLKSPSSIILHPQGKFLYAVSQVTDEVAIFRVNKTTGSLTETKESPIKVAVRSAFVLDISPDGKLLYVPGRFTRNLMVYRINQSTGALTPLKDNDFSTKGERARFVEATPDGRFVYVSNTVSDTVAGFEINTDKETVKPIKGMPFPTGDAPQAGMAHPSSKYLYVANWRTSDISAYSINQSTGVLTAIEGSEAETNAWPFNGSVHPSGKFLYVANWGSSDVSGFNINQKTGALSPMPGMPVDTNGTQPVTVQLDAEGRHAYVPNYLSFDMTVFDVDKKTGRLVNPRKFFSRPAVRSVAVLHGDKPVGLSAQWMIATDSTSNTIRSYSVSEKTGELRFRHELKLDTTAENISLHSAAGLMFSAGQNKRLDIYRVSQKGVINKVSNSSILLDGTIRGIRVNQRGSHLYALTQAPNQYIAYEINTEKTRLIEVQRINLPADSKPIHLTASPTERLTFVLDGNGGRLFAYRYVEASGPVMYELNKYGSPFTVGKGSSDMALDPTGRYGLVVNSEKATLDIYKMPGAWGPIKSIKKSPIAVGQRPVSVTVNPNGRYFYVVDAGLSQVHQFHLNTGNGEVSAVSTSVSVNDKTGGVPQELIIEPSGRFAYLRFIGRKGITRFNIDRTTGQLTRPVIIANNISFSEIAFTTIVQ